MALNIYCIETSIVIKDCALHKSLSNTSVLILLHKFVGTGRQVLENREGVNFTLNITTTCNVLIPLKNTLNQFLAPNIISSFFLQKGN